MIDSFTFVVEFIVAVAAVTATVCAAVKFAEFRKFLVALFMGAILIIVYMST